MSVGIAALIYVAIFYARRAYRNYKAKKAAQAVPPFCVKLNHFVNVN